VDGIVQGARRRLAGLDEGCGSHASLGVGRVGAADVPKTACLRPAFECILKEMRDLTAQQLTCAVL
jgi:hypothetical protein